MPGKTGRRHAGDYGENRRKNNVPERPLRLRWKNSNPRYSKAGSNSLEVLTYRCPYCGRLVAIGPKPGFVEIIVKGAKFLLEGEIKSGTCRRCNGDFCGASNGLTSQEKGFNDVR